MANCSQGSVKDVHSQDQQIPAHQSKTKETPVERSIASPSSAHRQKKIATAKVAVTDTPIPTNRRLDPFHSVSDGTEFVVLTSIPLQKVTTCTEGKENYDAYSADCGDERYRSTQVLLIGSANTKTSDSLAHYATTKA
jgi:hypothetical protein